MPNRLAHEKSPYLLQHANNPVDWYPWSEEAFEKARREQKPIFLSVGYSTCHWCHVMERESFENTSIAALLNSYFVSIKVDREERPDVDRIYMTALQAMGQNGGWPMSMFLKPDLKPFYGGTYFPPQSRSGRAGFAEVLTKIHEIWESERGKVEESAERITEFLQDVGRHAPADAEPGSGVLDTCFEQFSSSFDSQHGGFGGAPKFPRPVVSNFLLRYHARTGNRAALDMTCQTLRAMAAGGIYDHVGGGFHRYSVDAEWRIPHFEKMLYDQAQLVCSYADAALITRDPFFEHVAADVLDYVSRDLQAPGGGFWSAEDADSARPETPGELGEGAFYLWTKGEIVDVLGKNDGEHVAAYFGVEEKGNVHVDPHDDFRGKNILFIRQSAAELAETAGMEKAGLLNVLARSRELLFARRQSRPRPRLDDKILTSWNGLMITAYARAFQAFGNPSYLKIAERAAKFLQTHLGASGQLDVRRRFRDGETKFAGMLDDYAFVAQAFLDLYESSFDVEHLERALHMTSRQIEMFWDETNGGFFDTAGGDPSLLVRLKDYYDGAEPAGNSVSCMNLLRLGEMLDNRDFREKGRKVLAVASRILGVQPTAMPQMAAALDFSLGKATQVFIVGRRDDPAAARMVREVRRRYSPHRVMMFLEPGVTQERLAALFPFVGSLSMQGGQPTMYICTEYACRLPTTDPDVAGKLLDEVNPIFWEKR